MADDDGLDDDDDTDTELEKLQKLVDNLKAELKTVKGDRTPQDEKDRQAIVKLKRRVAELEPMAKKAQELEDASKSEQEKLLDQVKQLEERANKAEADALRSSIAAEKGLTSAQSRRLVGATKEELEADADELLESFKPAGGTGGGGSGSGGPVGRPREALRGGGAPDDGDVEVDIKKVVDAIPRD